MTKVWPVFSKKLAEELKKSVIELKNWTIEFLNFGFLYLLKKIYFGNPWKSLILISISVNGHALLNFMKINDVTTFTGQHVRKPSETRRL